MIPVTITHIGQNLDLKRKVFEHTLQLTLQDGSVIVATVDESAVEKLMAHVANESGEPPPFDDRSGQEPDEFANAIYDGQEARVFGGVPEQLEQEEQGQLALPVDPPSPRAARAVRMPQPIRIKTVPKDEYGYPTGVATAPQADPSAQEEDDGVPQL